MNNFKWNNYREVVNVKIKMNLTKNQNINIDFTFKFTFSGHTRKKTFNVCENNLIMTKCKHLNFHHKPGWNKILNLKILCQLG